MRLGGAFCVLFVLLAGAAHATPDSCDFDEATYENLQNPDITFWSEPYTPLSSVFDEGDGIYRFPKISGEKVRKFATAGGETGDGKDISPRRSYFLVEPNGDRPRIWRTYDEFETNSVPYFFFDEKFDWVDTKNVKRAPAYFFMPGMKDIPTAFFRLRNCLIPGVPIPVLRPQDVITTQNCPIEQAVFENIREPSISLWFEPTTQRSFTELAMVIAGDKIPKRAWLMEMQNGTGLPILYGTTEDDTDSAGLLFTYDGLGRPSSKDPTTRFVFPDGLPEDIPYAMFRLKECKLGTKPAQ